MNAYLLSRPAERDIHGILDRIARDAVRNADRFINLLYLKFDKLAANPFRGTTCEQFGAGMRCFPFRAYAA